MGNKGKSKIEKNTYNDKRYDYLDEEIKTYQNLNEIPDESFVDDTIDPTELYSEEYLRDMEYYLDRHKEEIEESYSFIKRYFEKQLNKAGIYYTIKLRSKSGTSAKKKILKKEDKNSYKIQDVIGVRILVNFVDDLPILKDILQEHPLNILTSQSINRYKTNEFGIMKTNFVWKLNDESNAFSILGATVEEENNLKHFNEELYDRFPIDHTFEIQLRTSTFDSYHEIDHEMRYKNDNAWDKIEFPDENRRFNGILATLELCDWSMSQLIDDMAHIQYKQKNWIQMLQHRFKIKLNKPYEDTEEEKELIEFCNYLDTNPEYAHDLYKIKREKLITYLWKNKEDNDKKLNYSILIRAIKKILKNKI